MKRVASLVLLALVVAACNVNIAGKQLVGMPPSYPVQAEFPTTIGLYPGSFVRQLGIDVGSVSNVRNEGNHVLVTMKIFDKYRLSPSARAILVGNSVLGERYVQFEPAYISGPAMAKGTVLTLDRTTVPVETDQVLRSLNTVLSGINPTDIRQFTTNLATILDGEGAKLNTLIHNAAGTVQILADKGNQLGQLSSTLAKLTGQLDTKDAALASLIRDYDLLAQTLAADRGQLDATITQLTNLTTQGADLLAPNLTTIQQDAAGIATATQTLDRNIPALDIGLNYAPRLFSAAQRAYDPLHNWLPLNAQTNPHETAAVLGASVRDALASLCRRLAAKQPALGASLAACGNPASGFFDPIIGLLPTVLGQIPGSTAPTSATDAFRAGVGAIPGLSGQQRSALTTPAAIGTASVSTPTNATQTGSASTAPTGPPGAEAVAALSATALPGSVTATAPSPVAKHHHRRGVVGGLLHWMRGLL